MKIKLLLGLIFLAGCSNQTHKPFVTGKSTEPYGVISGIKDKNIGTYVEIGAVDGRLSIIGIFDRKDIFDGSTTFITPASRSKTVRIEPGERTFSIYCTYYKENKYSALEIIFQVENGKSYSISCEPSTNENYATYTIKDENMKKVNFTTKLSVTGG
ncbi:hypothetical protein [Pseudoalteromonas spongiae]|uniref:hypothetical protein n=1 Tax=Pseudoalteromonas spongiae TaxID=298657 RepID=UPI00110BC780|nr:hypothetical protein [Pseudoalteromonas spongiae]TMO83092.1 hypothetical protein CWC15_16675 [Pseudoalteromonas spongiae]